jgi:hypothetical protein
VNEELILKILNVPVLVGWLSMVLAPRSRFTRWLVESDVLPLGIGVLYLALVAPHLPGLLREFDTLEHIGAALQRPGLLLAAWIHYLAFDFMVGRVVLADAQRRGIPHLLVVPCLLLTFLLGPVGYLTYAAVRLLSRRFLPAVAPLPAPAH